jgi:hypothetical protein
MVPIGFVSSFCLHRGIGGIYVGFVRIGSRRFRVRLLSQPLGEFERFDVEALPPSRLVTGLMQLPVMAAV